LKKIITQTDDLLEDDVEYSRRDFIKNSAIITSSLALGSSELFARRRGREKTLTLHSTHLNKTFHANFYDGHRYNITGLFQIDKAMMDYRAWQIARIDLKLVNLLYEINRFVGHHHTIDIVSGYRSPRTNLYLRRHSRGVAKRSYHMKAQAADIHIHGIRLNKLRRIARSIGAGGVGYYPHSNFVHVDVGPVRSWRG